MADDPSTPSINAVAALAGVSTATVSRVLNNSKPVNDATRRKVEAAVAQLGYRANAFGRILRKAESRLLLVLVPDFSNPYYAEIVRGVESVTRHRGYHIVLADTPAGWDDDGSALDTLYNRMTDGVISLAHIHEQPEVIAKVRDLPWVSCSEFMPGSGVPYVSIDHRQAAIDAVQYLLNRGHRRIALITADEDFLWARQRREGYAAALARAGIAVDPALIRVAPGVDYAPGSAAAGGLLSLPELPTAVFAVSDTLAIGAMKALRRAGKRVPQDIAVMGFDNIPIAEVFEPGLTTIAQPMHELGRAACEMVLARLAGQRPEPQTLPHSLVVRESA